MTAGNVERVVRTNGRGLFLKETSLMPGVYQNL